MKSGAVNAGLMKTNNYENNAQYVQYYGKVPNILSRVNGEV